MDGGGVRWDVSGVGGWDNTWTSDGDGFSLGDGNNVWSTDIFDTSSDGDGGWFWAVGGVVSLGDVGGNSRVRSRNGGG